LTLTSYLSYEAGNFSFTQSRVVRPVIHKSFLLTLCRKSGTQGFHLSYLLSHHWDGSLKKLRHTSSSLKSILLVTFVVSALNFKGTTAGRELGFIESEGVLCSYIRRPSDSPRGDSIGEEVTLSSSDSTFSNRSKDSSNSEYTTWCTLSKNLFSTIARNQIPNSRSFHSTQQLT
jgi:hypothetical protein